MSTTSSSSERNSTDPPLAFAHRGLAGARTCVLVDCDDYVHGVRFLPEQPLPRRALADALARYDQLLSAADGIVCATKFIAERYARFAPTYLAPSGYDRGAYAAEHADRGDVVIGWHGGSLGHERCRCRSGCPPSRGSCAVTPTRGSCRSGSTTRPTCGGCSGAAAATFQRCRSRVPHRGQKVRRCAAGTMWHAKSRIA